MFQPKELTVESLTQTRSTFRAAKQSTTTPMAAKEDAEKYQRRNASLYSEISKTT